MYTCIHIYTHECLTIHPPPQCSTNISQKSALQSFYIVNSVASGLFRKSNHPPSAATQHAEASAAHAHHPPSIFRKTQLAPTFTSKKITVLSSKNLVQEAHAHRGPGKLLKTQLATVFTFKSSYRADFREILPRRPMRIVRSVKFSKVSSLLHLSCKMNWS